MKLTEQNLPKLENYINLTEAAERLGITRQWFNKLAQEGVFRTIRQVGNQAMFVVDEREIADMQPALLRRAS